jgi:hypothetical protein
MIISVFLSAMMFAAIAAGLALRRRAPAVGVAAVVAATGGLYFIWAPTHLSAMAHALGVGRGTDLLLYLWVSLTMLALVGLMFELRHLQRQLTVLVRELSLQRARRDAPVAPPSACATDERDATGDEVTGSAKPAP